MLDVRIALVRKDIAGSVTAQMNVGSEAAERKTAVLKHLREQLEAMRERPLHWQPYRIDDPQLREWATRLNALDSELSSLITTIDDISPDDVKDWAVRTTETATELETLIERISLRLDELGW